MLITTYNEPALGDTLIAILGPDQATQTVKRQGDIVGIYGANGDAIGFNFFKLRQWLPDFSGHGAVTLTPAQLTTLNQAIAAADLPGALPLRTPARIVIGKIVEFTAHPDSDHLHVAKVDLGAEGIKQIVCGAPNAALGQTVVAALPGAMMPDGKLIWPGKLRGVDSYGMLCAARELALPNAPQARGILIMPDNLLAGAPFDFDQAATLLAAQA
jgi:tRNA-binding protein